MRQTLSKAGAERSSPWSHCHVKGPQMAVAEPKRRCIPNSSMGLPCQQPQPRSPWLRPPSIGAFTDSGLVRGGPAMHRVQEGLLSAARGAGGCNQLWDNELPTLTVP